MIDRSPELRPAPGLERMVREELSHILERLPAETAELRLPVLGGESPFEVRPTNPRAAAFSVVVIANHDLEVTIGKAATREFYGFARGGTVIAGRSAEEEFRSLVHAVMEGGFTEEVFYNIRGHLVRSQLQLRIDNTDIHFGDGRWLRLPFLKRRKETITYEAYSL